MPKDWTLDEPLQLITSGFGGQGVMIIGQMLAYAGMKAGKHVSWIPSYGPEMRGGTANCGTIISEVPIGSPLVAEPNAGIMMNAPSLDKFEPLFAPGSPLVINSSLIPRQVQRTDLKVAYVDATELAIELGNRKVTSMVILGAFVELYGQIPVEAVHAVLGKLLKESLIEINIRALARGARAVREQAPAVRT